MEENDYKAAHESFVSGHGGTTPLEIMLVSLVVPVSILLLAFVRRVGYLCSNYESHRIGLQTDKSDH